MAAWKVTPSNTVSTSEAIYLSQSSDGPDPQRVLVQNTGSAVLYLNWDAAADNTHLQVPAGGSVEFICDTTQILFGFCATSTTVVIASNRTAP